MKTWQKFVGALVLVIIVGMGFMFFKNGKQNTHTVEKRDIISKVEFVGTVKADKDLNLGFEVSGKIKKVNANENDFVEKGSKLVELDSTDLQTELLQARANLSAANASYNQQKAMLNAENSKLQKLLDGSTQEEINILKANIEIREKELNKANKLVNDAYLELEENLQIEANNIKPTIERSFNSAVSSLYTYSDLQFKIYPFASSESTWVDYYKGQFIQMGFDVYDAGRFSNPNIATLNGGIKQKLNNNIINLEELILIADEVKLAIDSLQSGYESFGINSNSESSDLSLINIEKNSLANARLDIINAQKRIQDTQNMAKEKISARESDVEIAEKALEQAKLELVKTETGPTQTEIDIQNSAIEQAKALLDSRGSQIGIQKARIASIQAEIAKKTLIAPIDGTISQIYLNEGEIVAATEDIIHLLATDKLFIEIDLPERNLSNITKGKEVEISFDAFPGEVFVGSVEKIDVNSTIVDKVPVFRTEIILDPDGKNILSGMTGDVSIVLEKEENVIAIPKLFLIEKDEAYFVLVENGKSAKEIEVKVGKKSSDGYVEIMDGLKEGMKIIEPTEND